MIPVMRKSQYYQGWEGKEEEKVRISRIREGLKIGRNEVRKLKLEMGGDEKTSRIKEDYGSRFSSCPQESREIHKTEDIVLQF